MGLEISGNPRDIKERRGYSMKDLTFNKDNIVWYSVNEIFPNKHVLFEDKIEFSDIKQGLLGDCYFLGAISAVVTEFPELIVEVFRNLKVTPNGCNEIVMRINEIWQIVLLDNYFPCDKETKKPVFSSPNPAKIWELLLKKHWLKLMKDI